MNENTKPNEDIEIKDEELELKDDELDGVSGGVNANAMLTPNLAGPITRD
ncbi:MAG: hypothetical protein Q4B67_04595 [Eubacteriales bacterium]|nr:hypothetical protein [Eubacteriales bacterium]